MNQFLGLSAGLFCCALPVLAPAQSGLATNEPHTVVKYVDAKHQELPSAEGAATRVETQFADSVQAVERTYDVDGTKIMALPYENYRKRVLHGVAEHWYKNGQLRWRTTWAHGQRNGELVAYYPTGQLKRREQYASGKRTAGECFGPDGQPVAFTEFEVMPNPPGGMAGLMNHLGRNIRYPSDALRKRIQGQVLVKFLVDSLGQVKDIAVTQGLYPSLDAEAVRVLSIMPPWQPGHQDGKAIQVVYQVPISFVIKGLTPRRNKQQDETQR